MKKKILSLALALVMCLGLTVPAFAAESGWKLEVSGKPNAYVGERTFTVRDWAISDPYEDGDYMRTLTRTDSRQYTAKNLYTLSKGDTAVFTKGGEEFGCLYITAWSDPDRDGVYDNQLFVSYMLDDGFSYDDFLPIDIASPPRVNDCVTSFMFGLVDKAAMASYMGPGADLSVDEYGSWDPVGFPALTVTELKMRPDFLLELFGPNTLVSVTAYGEGGKEYDVCTILVEGPQSTVPTTPTVGGFTDVKTSDYFAEPVQWAVEKKITAGTSATTFSPNATCSQGQILTFLWRAKGEPNPTGTVSGTQYYATAAQWAKEQGLTDNFSAETDCTRAMVVTYLWKLAGSPKAGASNFSDVAANADYAQAVAWAVEQGITSGIGSGQFGPSATCTRGQIVSFLYRAFAK